MILNIATKNSQLTLEKLMNDELREILFSIVSFYFQKMFIFLEKKPIHIIHYDFYHIVIS